MFAQKRLASAKSIWLRFGCGLLWQRCLLAVFLRRNQSPHRTCIENRDICIIVILLSQWQIVGAAEAPSAGTRQTVAGGHQIILFRLALTNERFLPLFYWFIRSVFEDMGGWPSASAALYFDQSWIPPCHLGKIRNYCVKWSITIRELDGRAWTHCGQFADPASAPVATTRRRAMKIGTELLSLSYFKHSEDR